MSAPNSNPVPSIKEFGTSLIPIVIVISSLMSIDGGIKGWRGEGLAEELGGHGVTGSLFGVAMGVVFGIGCWVLFLGTFVLVRWARSSTPRLLVVLLMIIGLHGAYRWATHGWSSAKGLLLNYTIVFGIGVAIAAILTPWMRRKRE